VELARREVDPHLRVGSGAPGPGGRLGDGTLDHPGAELDDEPGALGQGDEALRADQSDSRALPAHQRLAGDDLAALEVDDRLVVEP
jgi:hypothetical protein